MSEETYRSTFGCSSLVSVVSQHTKPIDNSFGGATPHVAADRILEKPNATKGLTFVHLKWKDGDVLLVAVLQLVKRAVLGL